MTDEEKTAKSSEEWEALLTSSESIEYLEILIAECKAFRAERKARRNAPDQPISPYSREYRERKEIDPTRFSVHSWGDHQKTAEEVIAENAKSREDGDR